VDVVCLIDVLHYLPADEQVPLLDKLVRILPPRGVMLIREIDRQAGLPAKLAMAAEHAMSALRGEPGRGFSFRSAGDWRRDLAAAGLTVEERAMDAGTPFANVLMVGSRT
jgi:hypothetical protein